MRTHSRQNPHSLTQCPHPHGRLCRRQRPRQLGNLTSPKHTLVTPPVSFFGFEVDSQGTRLAEKNLNPVRRMVPPSNLHELRSTLGLFVQSSRFITRYAHIVQPLTALTRTDQGKPVPFTWTDAQQHAFDHICNLLREWIHLPPADYRLPFHSGEMPATTARLTASSSTATYRQAQHLWLRSILPRKPNFS